MLEGGVSTGGQVTDALFVYKSAKVLEASLNLKPHPKVFYGIGAGLEQYKNERIFPVFIQFRGLAKKTDSSGFVSVQAGYGIVSTINANHYLQLRSQGGLFFSPGLGYKIHVSKYIIFLGAHYKHQFITRTYTASQERVYKNEINLHLLSFKAAVILD